VSAEQPTPTPSPADDRVARQRYILSTAWFTVPGTFVAIGVAFALLPPLPGPQEPLDRLLVAVRWMAVALVPYAAVCLWIAFARLIEGSHNPLAGNESQALRIHCRVMQNTLEQLAWFAPCTLVVASYLSPEQTRIIPVLCVSFAFARFVYWWGYLRAGTLGRAPGVQITLSLNVSLLVAALYLLAKHSIQSAAQ
jgi:uncharacterized membrane protein YecN with MAPEG domain